jgi:Photoprotection regulator fluorescence recovery protein
MATSSCSAAGYSTTGRDLKWSREEKAIARKAFDLALARELDAVIREAKERATRLEAPSELWEMERWLTQRRQEIDSKYDFRYSVLPLVFANLLRDGRISDHELRGLGQDKLELTRRAASL